MKTCPKVILTSAIVAGVAAVLWSPEEARNSRRGFFPGTKPAQSAFPPAVKASQASLEKENPGPLLPPPVLGIPPSMLTAGAALEAGGAPPVYGLYGVRPAEEVAMTRWAARDPEAAGYWLNANRQHAASAAMVRGYAIQIATIDPAAARQWAARLPPGQNVMPHGGTLEQHIDAVERMLNGQPPLADQTMLFEDYRPVLVRQNEGEEPVLEMEPLSPFR